MRPIVKLGNNGRQALVMSEVGTSQDAGVSLGANFQG